MQAVRKELRDGVFFTYIPSRKFKTGLLSAQAITPLDRASASLGALLPSVLRRGTVRFPDLKSLSCELDRLYGASVSYTVRKKGENQCLGFLAGFVDDSFTPENEKLLEPMAALLGEMLLDPATKNGGFLPAYVESERANLTDEIRALRNDKRDYADFRLLQEMCAAERYGIDRLGSEDAAAAITPDALWRYRQALLETAQFELFYCGSAEQSRVEDALSRALSALPRSAVTPPIAAEKRPAPAEVRYVREALDVTQGKLSLGFRVSSEDDAAAMLANVIFGGYSNSKLFLNVREKLSLCYYASSSYHRSKRIVTVSSGIECKNYQVALDEIMAQLDAVGQGKIDSWELEGARSCLISAIESREDSASRLEEYALAQPATGIWETSEELITALRGVTAERVAAAARTFLPDTVYFLEGKE